MIVTMDFSMTGQQEGAQPNAERHTALRLIGASLLFVMATTAVAQMPLVLQDPPIPTAEDWRHARPVLEAALECRAKLPRAGAVKAVLGVTNDLLSGHFLLPGVLKPFGLRTRQIWITEGAREQESYIALFSETTLSAVVQAARLRQLPNTQRYGRRTVGGYLEAESVAPGTVALTCRWLVSGDGAVKIFPAEARTP